MLQEEDDEEVRGDREGDDGDVERRPMSRYEKKLKEHETLLTIFGWNHGRNSRLQVDHEHDVESDDVAE